MLNWEIIHEMDDEKTGAPTCWAAEINHQEYGKFIWITLDCEGKYNIEISINGNYKVLASCKTFPSAKRWTTRYIR